MTSHQMQSLIEYLPTKEEKSLLKSYLKNSTENDFELKRNSLCECEKFMLAMSDIDDPAKKINTLVFMSSFSSLSEDIEKDAVLIEKACNELLSSVRLRKLLGVVLNIGNRLNMAGANSKSKVGAFSLDSLLKLNQAKAVGDTSKKMTFLHYVVMVVRRNNTPLLEFYKDLEHVFKAERINLELATIELGNLGRQLALAKAVHQQLLNASEEKEDSIQFAALGRFIVEASVRVQSIGNLYEEASKRYSELLNYFGESKRLQPHEIFYIFVKFSEAFCSTVNDVEKTEKAKVCISDRVSR